MFVSVVSMSFAASETAPWLAFPAATVVMTWVEPSLKWNGGVFDPGVAPVPRWFPPPPLSRKTTAPTDPRNIIQPGRRFLGGEPEAQAARGAPRTFGVHSTGIGPGDILPRNMNL